MESTAISMAPSDTFYTIITHSARDTTTQRGEITSVDTSTPYEVVQTTAGALPKTRTSGTTTVVAGHLYQIYGHCGNPL
jgi:hypothetical protein